MKYYVYCLFRRSEHQPCYVGATYNLEQRKQQHRGQYGGGFTIVLWETLNTVAQAACRESELIAEFEALGIRLDNRETASPYQGPDAELHAFKGYKAAQAEARQSAERLEISAVFNSPEFAALAASCLKR